MTITSPGLNGVLQAYGNQKVTATEGRPTARTKATSGDQVILSQQARYLSRAREIVALSSPVRREKVERLAEAIAAGTYQVDPEAVAEKLLAAPRLFDREV
ncbi:MAG: negative regulator of flagellin synthesis FlgM [Bacillota bacterium]|nr:negative regulator of flagellin synthesis FlgM [Bacillota bacterium]